MLFPLSSKVKLQGMLRLILIDGQVEVHYLANGKQHTPCGTEVIGVDKGYSEVFADSEGSFHGEGFNQLLTPISHARMENNRARNKLFQIAEKASAKKKARIYKNNLGTKKRVQQNRKIKQQIRTHCFKAAHSVVDDAAQVIAEDLTSPIPKKNQWKQFNRLMNSWMKGAITEALEKVTKLRGSELHYINAAYTSQMDSNTHHLQGKRVGDKFYHVNGEVSQADVNAACNIKHRHADKAITRYMPYRQVKRILLDRLHVSKELSAVMSTDIAVETVPSGL